MAALGPAGTFSEIAAAKYIETINGFTEVILYPTLTKVFNAIGSECELGIIPIENTLDGYVQITLDLLAQTDLQIISELILPVQFSFIGNSPEISNISKIYVQFKTQGQCYNFLEQFEKVKIIITESNGESLAEIKKGVLGEAGIVPKYTLNTRNKFPLYIENVTDSEENETRFIVLSKKTINYDPNQHYKTSIAIMNAVNKPGELSKILNILSQKNINLTSIISRPTKKTLGKYYFFIDFEGHSFEDQNIKEAIEEISSSNTIKILGSYSLI